MSWYWEENEMTTTDRTICRNEIQKRAGESIIYTMDFTPVLTAASETISSITSVACSDGNVTLSGEVVNSTAVTLDDDREDSVTIDANKAVQVRVAGGAASTTAATVTIKVATSASNTRERVGKLLVR